MFEMAAENNRGGLFSEVAEKRTTPSPPTVSGWSPGWSRTASRGAGRSWQNEAIPLVSQEPDKGVLPLELLEEPEGTEMARKRSTSHFSRFWTS